MSTIGIRLLLAQIHDTEAAASTIQDVLETVALPLMTPIEMSNMIVFDLIRCNKQTEIYHS